MACSCVRWTAPAGVYGISGTFSRHAILELAASMPRVPASHPMLNVGC